MLPLRKKPPLENGRAHSDRYKPCTSYSIPLQWTACPGKTSADLFPWRKRMPYAWLRCASYLPRPWDLPAGPRSAPEFPAYTFLLSFHILPKCRSLEDNSSIYCIYDRNQKRTSDELLVSVRWYHRPAALYG